MQALGLIETRGLLAAIESADAMLKCANVSIFEKTYVGGGLVSIAITGDVGAVKAAVEAGVAAVKKIDSTLLISQHVIPRPDDELKNIIGLKKPEEVLKTSQNDEEINNEEIFKEVNNEEIEQCISNEKIIKETDNEETVQKFDYIINDSEKDNSLPKNLQEQNYNDLKIDLNSLQKATVDNLVNEFGIEKTIKMLTKLKVAKLRELARQYKDFKVTEGKISKASKKLLITKFRAYYE